MPTYVYECEADKSHRYEKIQKMSEASDTICPTCGGSVHRVITGGVGLIFNGSGFYGTDYKGKNPSLGAPKSSGEACESCESNPSATSEPKKASTGCGPNCGHNH